MSKKFSIYFDAKDYEICQVVNEFIQDRDSEGDAAQQKLFRASLHPHGIKELAVSKELRIAEAVIELLGSLEAGRVQDRIDALQCLHDEVLYAESSTFRHNTGRVLIQIMKELIRSHDHPDKQLRLAHDFRMAATGRRAIVQKMLKRYFLIEMPEEWNQLAFDNHVHDANTKGRKSPTHLIMDAWIKGIRKLNVVYYNYVEPSAVKELLEAADIMEIDVNVGVEFQAHFRGRYVQFVWEPKGFENYKEFLNFLDESAPSTVMEMGRRASAFHHKYVMKLMDRYNESLRFGIGEKYNMTLAPVSEAEVLELVGRGQTSRTHLAELIFKQLTDHLNQTLPEIREHYAKASGDEKKEIEDLINRANSLSPDSITEEWLSYEKNPDIPLPRYTEDMISVPEIMRFLPATIIGWLTSINPQCNIILNLKSLSTEDVLELIYSCEGMITHLELFNLKYYAAGLMKSMSDISILLTAINEGSAIALKRLIRTSISKYSCSEAEDKDERCNVFTDILKNIPKIQNYYSASPLKTRIGSDSTSRTSRLHGMGFVFPETLNSRGRSSIKDKKLKTESVPLSQNIYRRITYYPKPYHKLGNTFTSMIRRLPGCSLFGAERKGEWIQDARSAEYSEEGNINLLGGFQYKKRDDYSLTEAPEEKVESKLNYLNNTGKNILKIVFGFALTVLTFNFTQDWWFLVWFGPIIWFGITGFRNVIQATLGGGGLRGSPLLRWNDYLSWSRLSDSLLYTGLSVPLLELGVRWFLMENVLGLSPVDNPLVFFTTISLVNGFYIAGHNLYRGLPTEAVVGNIFRSFLAIPVSIAYNQGFLELFTFMGWNIILVQQGAAVISKLASDTVAAIIEGFADKVEFLRIRHWDYAAKSRQLFDTLSKLDVLLPDKDLVEHFRLCSMNKNPSDNPSIEKLERVVIIAALDFLYFWMYLPRSRDSFRELLSGLTRDEKVIFVYSQSVLLNVQRVSQLFVDGLVGQSFARPLAFYLAKYEEYIKDVEKLTGIRIKYHKGSEG